jgi:hypothetical protein
MNGRLANKMKWYRMPRCTTALYDYLLCSTEFYCYPLCPTFGHIIGCFRPLSRGKSMYVQKKCARRPMQEDEENHRDRLCLYSAAKSIPSVLLLDEQNTYSWRRRVLGLDPKTRLPPRRMFPSSCFLASVLCSRLSLNSFKEPAHGMGYPSARRDRPELRNQLVRQRRALTFQARSRSARCLFTLSCEGKRALGISFLSPPLHCHDRLLCLHAR